MRKRLKESEIINLLRAIEVKISGGMGTEEACRSLRVSDKSILKEVLDFLGHRGYARSRYATQSSTYVSA